MRKNIFLSLPVIMLAFCFIACGGDTDIDTYTVTFNSNGGSEVAAQTGITSGATITLPSQPDKDGNTFDGWFTDNDNFTNAFTETTPVTSDITVYAKWTPKVVITADVYQYESETSFSGSVAEITAFTVNPEDTDEKIKDIGIVGSIKDGVLTIELPTVLDDSFLYTDEEGLFGDPGTKYGWVMFSPYLILNKYWDDRGEDSGWMGTGPFYIIKNESAGWFYTMNPTDYPDDAFTKPVSDQDELIADGFYWQLREEE